MWSLKTARRPGRMGKDKIRALVITGHKFLMTNAKTYKTNKYNKLNTVPLVRDEGVGGSNPLIPTNSGQGFRGFPRPFLFCVFGHIYDQPAYISPHKKPMHKRFDCYTSQHGHHKKTACQNYSQPGNILKSSAS